jgi:hypothetical protein
LAGDLFLEIGNILLALVELLSTHLEGSFG